ncbi:MAG: hypothetical protein IJT45_01730 [Bacteroidales bacterium]|nr:hypothetical protein [Bacteroidales bacterium]
MKKLLYLIAVACVLFGFTSCNKDKKIDVDYNVTVTLNPSTVISGFAPYDENDFDLDSDQMLRIQLFVYDNEGKLVFKDNKNVAGYSYNASFKLSLTEGDYRFLASSNVVYPDEIDNPEVWGFSLVDNINSIKIENVSSYIEYEAEILGLKLVEKSIKQSENINIEISSATALVFTRWVSVHYYDDIVDYYRLLTDKYMMARINDDVFNYSGSGYYWASTLLSSYIPTTSNNIYQYMAFLPKTNFTYTLYAFSENETLDVFEDTYTFKGGQQYHMEINIPELTIEVTENAKKVAPSDNMINNKSLSKVLDIIADNPNLRESFVK